ncbi:8-amino-7-oxononanoate synthase [Anoxybacillus ayderensis]|uniref:8-amino-7-oxononanoate synthase n=1 Tax=Anoxybacillus sp. ST70 TaxID=2864180 RepID=UPI0003168F87|nr:8-amino-7-oxononanoate synthase [Anoxybacillus sp. ST70]AXM90127.1 8-amino-7-oxononanoate synthase [Anoxybacillus ayderensis G10]MBW9218230.1 8-amino-7-oxononanoate synthase [Anoxybacillus sp. ST70]THD15877.1 8-amino-7-oxononanoate synthase [Anoxybacillus ayderensis]
MWEELQTHIEQLEKKAQKRALVNVESDGCFIRIDGQHAFNFSSNNYLGLANDERLIQANMEATRTYGVGATASRLVVGNHPLYEQAEDALIRWKGYEAALIVNSGYTANVGILSSLAGRDAVIFSDKWNHASIVDGAILSRAEVKRYRHADIDHLETLLKKTDKHKRKLIVTDTIFSMDGDVAPLRELVSLKEAYGAILVVDEAHASGVYGKNGEGMAHECQVAQHVDVHMGTFSKALGSYGAYVAGKRVFIDYLINTMRPFIFTTALPPSVLGAIYAAIDVVQKEPARRYHLRALSDHFRTRLQQAGFHIGESTTHIVPLIVGDNERALAFSARLRERGIFAVAIRPPTVPEGTARIRFSLMATMTKEQIDWALEHICAVGKEMGLIA